MPELLFKECDMNLNYADLRLFYVIWSHFSVQVVSMFLFPLLRKFVVEMLLSFFSVGL